MHGNPYQLVAPRRRVVLLAIVEVCRHRDWLLLAAHVRTAHVHVVVQAPETKPESVMTTFKAYASRALNTKGLEPPDTRRWTRHGSTRYLWTHKALRDTMKYVVEEQGEPMELVVADSVSLLP